MAKRFFPDNDIMRERYARRSPLPYSKKFYDFLDRQMVLLIKKGTGLSPSPQFMIALPSWPDDLETYEPGEISRLNFAVGIASATMYNIVFCWKSKSGNIIAVNSEEFDEDDLECWVEGLTPEIYYYDLARLTNKKLPFKIDKLPYELEIRDYGYSMNIYVSLNDGSTFDIINGDVDGIINQHNELADARAHGKAKGTVLLGLHNWNITAGEDGKMIIYLDAASPEVLKKIVEGLAKHKTVVKVEMDLV